MAQQSPNRHSNLNPRGWGTGKIIVLVLAVAAFVAMLTWDRGHFSSEQAVPVKQAK